MIIVKDDVIPKDYQDFIEDFVKNEIPWFYLSDISGTGQTFKDPNWVASGGFFHLALYDGVINSAFYNNRFNIESLIEVLSKKFEIDINQLFRIKFNLTTPVPGYKETNFCSPHVDLPDRKHFVMLYYINDSDGDTIFFKTPTDIYNEKLEIIDRITPKKGRCVLFDGSLYHTQSNPIYTPTRLNLNISFDLKD